MSAPAFVLDLNQEEGRLVCFWATERFQAEPMQPTSRKRGCGASGKFSVLTSRVHQGLPLSYLSAVRAGPMGYAMISALAEWLRRKDLLLRSYRMGRSHRVDRYRRVCRSEIVLHDSEADCKRSFKSCRIPLTE